MNQGINKHAEIAAQTKHSSEADSADELLRSANSASGSARNAWLAYLVLNVYLLVTISGVTHVDLLLNNTVTLPIVNVSVPLFSFFSVAPVLLLLVHLGLLVQHAMLAHKYDHYSKAVAPWEKRTKRVHPSRRHVDGYVFSQMNAGPRPPKLLGSLMRLMVFVTLSLSPVLVLLYFQIKFLPYHEVGVTHLHRIAIFLDLVLLFSVRPYITISYLRPRGSRLRIGSMDWPWELSYWSLAVSAVLCLAVLIFSLFVATVPQGCINPFEEHSESCISLDRIAAKWATRQVVSGKAQREVFALTHFFFEDRKDEETGKTLDSALFTRNIVVSDTDLVPDKDDTFAEVSVSLRDRDLRFAVLDRSDLHRADLSNANLKWSSLRETRLGKAKLIAADLRGANLRGAELQGADLQWARLQEANLKATQLQGAVLRRAQLQGANLGSVQLQGAILRNAQLQGADLSSGHLQGAVFHEAQLQGAILRNAQLQGADLKAAQLQGANFRSAQLQGADLSSARLQGAVLRLAQLQGANLGSAQLQGADIGTAQLQGANLHLAQLQGVDMRGIHIWQSRPPLEIHLELANLEGIEISALTDKAREDLARLIDAEKGTAWEAQLKQSLEPLLASGTTSWGDSNDRRIWDSRLEQPAPNRRDLSHFLADLVCSDGPGGYIADPITRRALRGRYSGDPDKFARKVSQVNCNGAEILGADLKFLLCSKSNTWSEADVQNSFCARPAIGSSPASPEQSQD